MAKIDPKFNVFPFSNSWGVMYFAVADWTQDEAYGKRRENRPAELARFEVSQRHQEHEQKERAEHLCRALNKQAELRAACKLEELA